MRNFIRRYPYTSFGAFLCLWLIALAVCIGRLGERQGTAVVNGATLLIFIIFVVAFYFIANGIMHTIVNNGAKDKDNG